MSKDPIGYYSNLNLYTFVNNSPIAFIDPFGLLTEVWPPGGQWPGQLPIPSDLGHLDGGLAVPASPQGPEDSPDDDEYDPEKVPSCKKKNKSSNVPTKVEPDSYDEPLTKDGKDTSSDKRSDPRDKDFFEQLVDYINYINSGHAPWEFVIY